MAGGKTFSIYIEATVGGDTGCTTYDFKIASDESSLLMGIHDNLPYLKMGDNVIEL